MVLPTQLAVACFLRQENKTLFMNYVNYPHPIHAGKYSPPGGRLEEGESLEIGASREVQEETGIITRNLAYRGVVTFLNERRTIKGKPMGSNWKVYFYDCHNFDDTNARATEGSLAWIEDNKVLDLPLHEGDRIIWRDWLSKYKEFEGEIKHGGEKLINARLIYYKP